MPAPDAKTRTNARPKPAPARRSGRRRRAAPGDLEALRRELWHGIRRVGDVLDKLDAEPGELCKAANALAAMSNAYRGVTEAAALLPRLEAIEQRLATEGRARR